MELFGIAFSIPAAFGAAIVYSLLVRKVVARLPWTRRPVLYGSVAILAALALEWYLLDTLGILGSREAIGPAFDLAHFAVFLLSIPALANVLVLQGIGWACLVAHDWDPVRTARPPGRSDAIRRL